MVQPGRHLGNGGVDDGQDGFLVGTTGAEVDHKLANAVELIVSLTAQGHDAVYHSVDGPVGDSWRMTRVG